MTHEEKIVDLNIKLGEANRKIEAAEAEATKWRRYHRKYVRDNRMTRVETHAVTLLAGMLANPETRATNERAMVLAIDLAKDFVKEIDRQWEEGR